ncbi:hypothetical protein PFICI_00054 [Pestalotiopsis fici W106-1]|uniref:DUF1593 domain-containing protein n=1 Tax=Pestalotiopsis fici (strain W106-1 / CGMCC3.15140) TaxID=1229662 RepID=W3XLV9_PESFW|nr:uncharacterized protein PFICI_00054 [Pestalotiopsis fici W106-1]ETS86226.1 hypothetical protein PFICI_00054 [Pestalotiopsis fici W106-1]
MLRYGFAAGLLAVQLASQAVTGVHSLISNRNSATDNLQSFSYKPRIFILSDILNEPDDSMSLVRYLLYSNEFNTTGLCATTSWWLQNETHPEEMERIINAYGEVVDNLNQHVHPSAQYQSPDELLQLVTSGPKIYGSAALDEPVSEGALRLIASLQASEDPLFVTAWGGTNTLAQALQYMDETLSESEASALRSRIRLYTISDQDDTGAWIRARYPEIFYIVSVHAWNDYGAATWTGINLATCACVDNETVLNPWLDTNVRLGPLGAVYPQIEYGMEGDTPSFLWLVQNGLVYRDRIDWGTWGGRYNLPQAPVDVAKGRAHISNQYVNGLDTVIGADGQSYSTAQATIWRWRSAYQDDLAARMQWTLTPNFTDAGHPPVINVNGHQGPDPLFLTVAPNQTYLLDAGLTVDPDAGGNGNLTFEWVLYPEPTKFLTSYVEVPIAAVNGTGEVLATNDAGFANATLGTAIQFTAPVEWTNPNTGVSMGFHILLQVTNSAGKYPITRYLRIVCEYES